VCIGNACRSPIAEAVARYDASDVIEPSSAGTNALGHIPEDTIKMLARFGYSDRGLKSKMLRKEDCEAAEIIINMTGQPSDDEFWEHGKVEDWLVEDPFCKDEATYQRVIEGIKRRIEQLAAGLREKKGKRGESNW
jgi:arsenate reductase (thioredoxin)